MTIPCSENQISQRQYSQRQQWMAVLAKASPEALAQLIRSLPPVPTYRFLRSPETGLTMVRGRAGSTGQVFNLGEMTLTRCVVQLDDDDLNGGDDAPGEPITGFGYVGGRSHRHAELAALCDALLQHPTWHNTIQMHIIKPLQTQAQQHRDTQQRQTEATRVNFFTLARGEVLEKS